MPFPTISATLPVFVCQNSAILAIICTNCIMNFSNLHTKPLFYTLKSESSVPSMSGCNNLRAKRP